MTTLACITALPVETEKESVKRIASERGKKPGGREKEIGKGKRASAKAAAASAATVIETEAASPRSRTLKHLCRQFSSLEVLEEDS